MISVRGGEEEGGAPRVGVGAESCEKSAKT